MATVLYIEETNTGRAAELGCGWMPEVPAQFASQVQDLPVIILSGAGTTKVLKEPTSTDAIAQALAPILAGEQAQRDAQGTADQNRLTIQQQAIAALVANRAFITGNKPATAAAQASAAYDQAVALSRQVNALIRVQFGQLDATN